PRQRNSNTAGRLRSLGTSSTLLTLPCLANRAAELRGTQPPTPMSRMDSAIQKPVPATASIPVHSEAVHRPEDFQPHFSRSRNIQLDTAVLRTKAIASTNPSPLLLYRHPRQCLALRALQPFPRLGTRPADPTFSSSNNGVADSLNKWEG